MVNLFIFIQLSILPSSQFTSVFKVLRHLLDKVSTASSANNLVFKLEASGSSFMYVTKSKGPSVDPCGTSQVTGRIFDLCSFTTVYCILSEM